MSDAWSERGEKKQAWRQQHEQQQKQPQEQKKKENNNDNNNDNDNGVNNNNSDNRNDNNNDNNNNNNNNNSSNNNNNNNNNTPASCPCILKTKLLIAAGIEMVDNISGTWTGLWIDSFKYEKLPVDGYSKEYQSHKTNLLLFSADEPGWAEWGDAASCVHPQHA